MIQIFTIILVFLNLSNSLAKNAELKGKLNSLGISEIVDSKIDTFKNIKYFSYRRSIHLKYRDYGRNLSLVSII